MRSRSRYQRRLKTCLALFAAPQPTFAGSRFAVAFWMPRAIIAGSSLTYSSLASLWKTPASVGAVCVWVAEMMIWLGGMPVAFWARRLASSVISRGTMQASMTHRASLV